METKSGKDFASPKLSLKIPQHDSLGLAVYNCGCEHCQPGYSWGPAIRDHYLFHYILNGKGVFCDGKTAEQSASKRRFSTEKQSIRCKKGTGF